MKISTRGRYALRLMLDLALESGDEYIKIREIARRQDISEKYLEQIVNILNKAGFVRSVRGASGGYKLAREPKEYTVGMILRLTEGSLVPVECVEYAESDCSKYDLCATIEVWKKLSEAISNVVDSVTLEDLVKTHNDKIQLKITSDYII